MTFTYTPGVGADDLTLVRARVGDRTELTDDDGVSLDTGIRSDEEILMWLDTEASVGGACIAWVQSVLLELDQEADSTQDWLELDFESARDNYLKMLDDLRDEFNLPSKSSPAQNVSFVKTWRSDTDYDNPN